MIIVLSTPGPAADKAAQQKISKYASLASTDILSHSHRDSRDMECHGYRVSTGDWATHHCITEDSRETTFLFQRLSIALQQGYAISFQNIMMTE